MPKIAIYTITSGLHAEVIPDAAQESFIKDIVAAMPEGEFAFPGQDFSTWGQSDLDLIYIRTGGTENAFAEAFPSLTGPIRLLTSGKSNSLAASMEILSYLGQHGREGEIIHGDTAYIAGRMGELLGSASSQEAVVSMARMELSQMRLGVVGRPSDWLISSNPDRAALKERLGLELVDIPMEELLEEIGKHSYELPESIDVQSIVAPANVLGRSVTPKITEESLTCALEIYGALKRLVEKYDLGGLTVRCFDLLSTVRNTGCLALAILNSEGIPSSCEGDIPALVTMCIANALVGVSGFQANPSRIDPATGEVVFAHCTIPFNMVDDYRFDTHFESGLGVAIKGEVPVGPVTIFKVGPDATRYFAAEAMLEANMSERSLCRTQVRLKAPGTASYFLTRSIGNHHVILPGHVGRLIDAFFREISK